MDSTTVEGVKIHNTTIDYRLHNKNPTTPTYIFPSTHRPFIKTSTTTGQGSTTITRLQPHPSLTRTGPSLLSCFIPFPVLYSSSAPASSALLVHTQQLGTYLPLFLLDWLSGIGISSLSFQVNKTASRKVNKR